MLRRLAIVAVAAGVAVLTAAGPASADDNTPDLHQTGPILAANYTQDCPTAGPYADKDVWVFVLPGKESGEFVSLSLQFDTDGNGSADTPISIPNQTYPSGIILQSEAGKAWIALPKGWALISGTSVVTGTAPFFNLTHTCKATTSSPSPSGTKSPSPSPSVSQSSGASESPSTSPSQSTPSSPGSSPSEGESTPGTPGPSQSSGGGLPTTGVALTGYALTGTVLIAAGVGALLFARRRRMEEADEA